jgi:ATP-dependent protease HslVU (ClpYQ) peptidase subunit
MTCIAAVADGKTVWMGCDSLVSGGGQTDVNKTPKVFIRDGLLIGTSGDCRFGQLMRYALAVPPLEVTESLETWLTCQFTKAVRECFKEHGLQEKEKDREMSGGTALLGIRGRLFCLSGWYSFVEPDRHFEAIGSGGDTGRGVLWATKEMPPNVRIEMALNAAADLCTGVRGPFIILSSP